MYEPAAARSPGAALTRPAEELAVGGQRHVGGAGIHRAPPEVETDANADPAVGEDASPAEIDSARQHNHHPERRSSQALRGGPSQVGPQRAE